MLIKSSEIKSNTFDLIVKNDLINDLLAMQGIYEISIYNKYTYNINKYT